MDMPIEVLFRRILLYVVLPAMLGGTMDYLTRKGSPKTILNWILSISISAMGGIVLILFLPFLGLKGVTYIDTYEQLLQISAFAFLFGLLVRKLMQVFSSKLLINVKDENADTKMQENQYESNLEEHIKVLKDEINLLKKSGKIDLIEDDVRTYIKDRMPHIINEYIEEGSALNESYISSFRAILQQKADDYLKSINLAELKQQKAEENEVLDRIKASETLQHVIRQERASSSFYKNVMINLFIIVNLGFLLVFIFREKPLTPETLASATGLYFSLAMFIIYIFRVSNSRTAVLLSIHEDLKKHFDIERYISKIRNSGAPTKEDVEIIRLLFTNRSEREKGGDHPYEVILKEVANSNIMFKGGKMTIKKDKPT